MRSRRTSACTAARRASATATTRWTRQTSGWSRSPATSGARRTSSSRPSRSSCALPWRRATRRASRPASLRGCMRAGSPCTGARAATRARRIAVSRRCILRRPLSCLLRHGGRRGCDGVPGGRARSLPVVAAQALYPFRYSFSLPATSMGTKKTTQPRSPTVVLGRTSPSASSSAGSSTAAAAADQRAARQMAGQFPLWTRMR